MEEDTGISRRRFLGYVIAAPTLVTGVRWVGGAPASAQTLPSGGQIAEHYDLLDFLRDAARPTANLITITVNEDGTVGFELHRTEVGQGISTAIAMVIADEMDLPLESVRITQADARPELLFNQLTGGSNSMYTIYHPVRLAAAVARQRLLAAAAIVLESAASSLTFADGLIRTPDGSSVGIGELTRSAASAVTEAVEVEPKSPDDQTIVGTPRNRIDAFGMVTGAHAYAMDLPVPEALPTMVARAPTINGTPRRVHNLDPVRAMPGVTDVVTVTTGVAVRAATFGQCIDAVRALDIEWGPGTVDGLSDDDVQAALAAAEQPMTVPDLDLPALGLPGVDALALTTVDHTFTFAFQPNCPLEPNPAIADVRDGRAEIWAPMKNPVVAQQDIAEALGLGQGDVTCHVVQGGGSFGRDLFWDAAREAALVSQAMGKPVKLMWHRTDDFRHGRVHPACRSTIRAVHTSDAIVAFAQHHTSVNTDFGHGLGEIISARMDELPGGLGGVGYSQTVWHLSQYVPYDFGVVEQLLNETLPGPLEGTNNLFHTSSMRNIYSPNVVTARELVIDRIVEAMGVDPFEYRLRSLKDERSKAVLRTVAEAGEWGRALPAGTAQGIAFHSEYKGRAACLVEIDATPATVERVVHGGFTGPRVTKAVFAVDVGLAVNPRGLEAQMMGGIMDGIANALTFGLHLRDGAFAEDSWEHAYYTRQWNVPTDVRVIVMPPTTGEPGGAGEFGVAASMAATACALARATGTMATHYPVNHGLPLPDTISPTTPPVPPSPSDGLAGIRR
jgi:isoquinoline 1-oxidoreductase beta subunit